MSIEILTNGEVIIGLLEDIRLCLAWGVILWAIALLLYVLKGDK